MRPCLNPGQMNPPGGTHSPAAWISPSQPHLTQTLQSSVCLLTHPYFSQCLPFTSPTKVHPSYALCHAVSPTSPTAFALTCGPSHMHMSYWLTVTAVFKSFGVSPSQDAGQLESPESARFEADSRPGHHLFLLKLFSQVFKDSSLNQVIKWVQVKSSLYIKSAFICSLDGPIPPSSDGVFISF